MKEKNINTQSKYSNLYRFEESLWQKNELLCGIDEVGRGCLAGPIVTAAAILNPGFYHPDLKDSKLLTRVQLENIYKDIVKNSSYTIGISAPKIIDQKNIYIATQITMKKALFHLLQKTEKLPSMIVIDAMPLDLANTPYENIQKESWTEGESKSASIAAASIIAKVTRDKIMEIMDASFPSYNLAAHKGYGTPAHIQALEKHKASIIHRTTFLKKLKGLNHDTQQQSLFC